MSMTYIMYMTPTLKEARRIGLMAKRINAVPLDRCVMLSPMPEDDPIYREPQFGHPRIRVRWMVATRNSDLAGDRYAWSRAITLYETRPYWIAWLTSHLDHWRTLRGKRVPIEFMKTQGDYLREDREEKERAARKKEEEKDEACTPDNP